MISFYHPSNNRYKIICEAKAFPSDQYAFESQVKYHGYDPNDAIIEITPRDGEYSLRTEDIIKIIKQHGKETSTLEPPKGFASKADYLSLFGKVRDATVANVDRLSESDLDKPTSGPMAPFAPTLGALILLVSNHTLMHAGQFTAVRRKLSKPVIF